jgi:hypothetical protein
MKNKIWLVIRIIFVFISLFSFSSFVIPQNVYTPTLGGIPYTLWVGILISISLLILIVIASKFLPSDEKGDD